MNIEQAIIGFFRFSYFFPAKQQQVGKYKKRSKIKQITQLQKDG
jgi:hypothetical protein